MYVYGSSTQSLRKAHETGSAKIPVVHSDCIIWASPFSVHWFHNALFFQAHASQSVLLSPMAWNPARAWLHYVRWGSCCLPAASLVDNLPCCPEVRAHCVKTPADCLRKHGMREFVFSTGSLCLSNCVKQVSAVISFRVARTPSCPLTWSCERCYVKKGWSFSVQVACIVVVANFWSKF